MYIYTYIHIFVLSCLLAPVHACSLAGLLACSLACLICWLSVGRLLACMADVCCLFAGWLAGWRAGRPAGRPTGRLQLLPLLSCAVPDV